jgi:hypothetical protein
VLSYYGVHAAMTQRMTVAVSEGVEDDDAEGMKVAGITGEGREGVDEEISGIVEVEAGIIAVVGGNSYIFDKSSL